MTHNKRLSLEDVRRDMNLALDNSLSDTDRTKFEQHLAVSPYDRMVWEGMQSVDRLLRSERGDMQAPPDFAMRVMASIAAGLRAVMGLLLAIALLLPVVLTTMLFVRHLLTDPTAQQVLLQQITIVVRAGAQAISSVFQVVASYVSSNVIIMGLLITSAGVTTLAWGWMIRYFAVRRTQVVYRIPVQAA